MRSVKLAEASQKTTEETAIAAKAIADANKEAIKLAAESNITNESSLETSKQSLEAFNDMARKQLRAYVAVDAVAISCDKDSGVLTATVTVVNSGQTPAHNVLGTACLHFEPQSYTENPGLCAFDPNAGMTLASGGKRSLSGPGQPKPEEVSLYYSGQLVVWVIGQVRYKDIFEVQHVTNFRFVQMNPKTPLALIQLGVATTGNESD
jgi:hypothetical protein